MMAPMRAKLPVFGRICSLAARALGRDPLDFAGPKQKLWHRDAQRALDKIAELGGHVANFSFVSRDERPQSALWEKIFARPLLDLDDGATSESDSLAHVFSWRPMGLFGSTPGEPRHAAMSKEGEHGAMDMAALGSALGSARAARVCMVAHEWAHAWQNSHGHEFSRRAALASASELTAPALEEIDRGSLSARLSGRRGAQEHSRAILRAEEGFCDAFACWVMDRMGMPGMAPKLAGCRQAMARMGASSSHHTQRSLSNFFPEDARMPERFEGFLALAMERGARASAHCFEPAAPKPAA